MQVANFLEFSVRCGAACLHHQLHTIWQKQTLMHWRITGKKRAEHHTY